MHNNIMAAGSRDRPPMLATGRYAQWQSRFMRYVDTKPNGEALKKCILQVPETFSNISPENKAHYDAKAEAINLILTGIGDDIYSTVDACKIAHDIFTSRDGESIESYYSRFYKMMNEMQTVDLDKESYHKLFDILKQYQKEVNEIHAKKIARNANPLALVAATQQYPDIYYQAPKSHKSYAPPSKQSSSTRSHTTTRHKGKEIAKPITPPSESASKEDIDPEQAQRDKDMQKDLTLIAKYFKKIYKHTNNNLITSSNSRNKNVDTSPRYLNENQTVQFGNQRTVIVAEARETVGNQEYRKPKRAKDYTYHKEKMLMCKQAEKGFPLRAEQSDWLEDTDEEIDKQELEAHYSFMAKIQEVLPVESRSDAEPLEKADQNTAECDDERVVLANLIANLTLDTEENKKIQKQLKKANASLTHELKECKSTLKETNRTLGESNRTRDRYLGALHDKEVELSNFENPKYLKKAQSEKPCLYEISYDKDDLANIFSPDREEILTLEQESRSKLNKDEVKPYDHIKQNSLYEIFKPPSREYFDQLDHAK
ncbi:hypothetical protein Tco_0236424 [Tanacetum coccineum]